VKQIFRIARGRVVALTDTSDDIALAGAFYS
jgi:hypothetical protein